MSCPHSQQISLRSPRTIHSLLSSSLSARLRCLCWAMSLTFWSKGARTHLPAALKQGRQKACPGRIVNLKGERLRCKDLTSARAYARRWQSQAEVVVVATQADAEQSTDFQTSLLRKHSERLQVLLATLNAGLLPTSQGLLCWRVDRVRGKRRSPIWSSLTQSDLRFRFSAHLRYLGARSRFHLALRLHSWFVTVDFDGQHQCRTFREKFNYKQGQLKCFYRLSVKDLHLQLFVSSFTAGSTDLLMSSRYWLNSADIKINRLLRLGQYTLSVQRPIRLQNSWLIRLLDIETESILGFETESAA